MAKKNKKTLASKADKYKCYLASVQSPEHEIDFFNQAFKEEFGRKPKTLREDFCGTFAVCCEWVRGNRKRSAIGVDLDPEPLAWGKKHNFSKLTQHEQDRVQILQQDVRKANRPRVEVLAAQNFSFWLFKTRSELLEYFRIARSNMADESIMVMDMMGGGECYVEGNVDKRVIKKGKKGFDYHWAQGTFNPVSHDASFYISFKFNDGSKLKRAFEYHWRFWTLAEVRELLAEAGFSHSHVYWEIEDEDGNDTGDWVRADDAVSNPSWVCYIVAVR